MTINETLSILLSELLAKVEEVKDHLIYEYDRYKGEWEEIDYILEALSHIEDIINTYNRRYKNV